MSCFCLSAEDRSGPEKNKRNISKLKEIIRSFRDEFLLHKFEFELTVTLM